MFERRAHWQLAPAYDLCHAYKPDHQWVSQHSLSISWKRQNITIEDLLVIGKSIRNKKAASIIDEIRNTVSCWETFANAVDVHPKLRKEIGKTLVLKWKQR